MHDKHWRRGKQQLEKIGVSASVVPEGALGHPRGENDVGVGESQKVEQTGEGVFFQRLGPKLSDCVSHPDGDGLAGKFFQQQWQTGG